MRNRMRGVAAARHADNRMHTSRRWLVGLLLAAAWAGAAHAASVPVRACDGDFQTVLAADPDTSAEARALWLDRRTIHWPAADASQRHFLYHSARGGLRASVGGPVQGAEGSIGLKSVRTPPSLPPDRFAQVEDGATFELDLNDDRLRQLLLQSLLLVREDADGHVLEATALQSAGALDDLYAAAVKAPGLGVQPSAAGTRFGVWAPTAQAVHICLYDDDRGHAGAIAPLHPDPATGLWSTTLPGNLSGHYYHYLVQVHARGTGLVRNRVTDPYSVGLGADSRRSYIANLDDPALSPDGWDSASRPPPLRAQTDMSIYELHVRDFSMGDPTVPAAHRGKYLAFTDTGSTGMAHLRALAGAGLTDVHLLPVFDFASVPESGCVVPEVPDAAPDSPLQQAAVMAHAARDCFNWGYDPFHFSVPEGSYASDAADGAARIREFRAMVMALHRLGLRVGMDVVYNHTHASGQDERSVLDRIVPGYYHRLDAAGNVERSTCCENTATEHAMMARLMIDSAALWVRHYGIDSFRFDLMGHQPRR